ncbi:MAG: alpha/beta fold hydrolase [Desulfobacteraceae bacterium]|nr:alpha/beta fold hydrolase [Desulfobacteraceae bacterium]
MTQVLRTPDERFAHLPGYSFSSYYVEDLKGYNGMRLHYLDDGPRDANQVFLCLHGEPTWSYLYRKMIPLFTDAGHRAVAPDLFGFGRSDKPVEDETYTFHFHRQALMALIQRLDLTHLTLVCQDWGGLLGLTLPMDMPDRFTRFLVMNTALGTGDVPLSEGFLAWRDWTHKHPDMEIGRLMSRTCPHLTEGECAAYEAPFPDASYKAGVRRFPNLVPDRPVAPGAKLSRRARDWLREEWSGKSFMAIGMKDPVLGAPVMRNLRKIIRGCPEPFQVQEAGHFVQEWGEEVAKRALESFG